MKNWKINSWRKYPVKHIPQYEDEKELEMVLNKLKTFPPLVFAGETRHLKDQLAMVNDGKAFLLQGGDCAESFAEFHPDNIRDTFKVLLQMSLVLTASEAISRHHKDTLKFFDELLSAGVCREQARGVLPQNLYTEYYGTTDLNNLIKFIKFFIFSTHRTFWLIFYSCFYFLFFWERFTKF